jgi:SPP1 gp7 family putative phage head morphogenesis protein
MNYTEDQIKELLKDVFDGKITQHDLPEDLYYAIADYLKEGLYQGFGIDLTRLTEKVTTRTLTEGWSETDLDLLSELRENIYMFSGAKTYQQVKDMRDLLSGEDKITEWADFRDAARSIYKQYNENWLSAEYDTAIGQAQNAVKWDLIEKNKELMPYLKYNAVEDNNECEICEPFNDLIAPVDDPIWSWAYPENHFKCRCTVDQIDKYEDVTLTSDDEKARLTSEVGDKMDDMFKMNAGKDRVVFSEEHPYFEVEKGDRDFAKRNFDLPIPESDEE